MAKTRSEEETQLQIAGKSYKLHKTPGTARTLPKGASCGATFPLRASAPQSRTGRRRRAKSSR
jgi:hypothetical protein